MAGCCAEKDVGFSDWYDELGLLMAGIFSNEHLPLDPDDWCSKDKWYKYYCQKLSPKQAMDAES